MLICIQKINLITHFFFKTLQKNSKHVILGKLGMPGHTHLQWWYQFEEIFDVYLEAKNQLHSSCFLWDIANLLQICYFGYFGQVCLHKPKMIASTGENFHVYLQAEEPVHPPCFSGDIAKISKIFILITLSMSGYTHPRWSYKPVENFDVSLQGKDKLKISIHFFLEISYFKESWCSIDQEHFDL